jgi:DNA-binding cell septation regulator SpoVG
MSKNRPPAGGKPAGREQRTDLSRSGANYSTFDLEKPDPLFNISIIDLQLTPDSGNLRALCAVKIGPLTVHGCRVIQQNQQAAYVALPQRPVDGGAWRPVITCDDVDFKDALRATVLAAYYDSQLHGGAPR